MATLTTNIATLTRRTAASPSCTTAVPDNHGHVPFGACNSYYNDDPSFEANLAFAALFGASFLAHIVQAIVYKKVQPPTTTSLCNGKNLTCRQYSDSAGCSSWAPRGRRQHLATVPWEPTTNKSGSMRSGGSFSFCWRRCVSARVEFASPPSTSAANQVLIKS